MTTGNERLLVMLNGSAHYLCGSGTIRSLLPELGASPEQVAIVVNENVIPRADWDSVKINAGDRIDVLTFAGGG